jgi:1,4-dihydroxy-2-naphthoate octaprenyltransferase
LLGDRLTRAWYLALVALAFAVALGAWPLGPLGWPALLILGSAVALWPPGRAIVRGDRGRALNAALKATARFNLVFGLLFALAIALS